MTSVDSYRLARSQNTIAESVRVAIRRTLTSLGMEACAETYKVVGDALRNVEQDYQIALDLDVDPSLGAPSAWEKAGEKCPPDLADAVCVLLGKAGR